MSDDLDRHVVLIRQRDGTEATVVWAGDVELFGWPPSELADPVTLLLSLRPSAGSRLVAEQAMRAAAACVGMLPTSFGAYPEWSEILTAVVAEEHRLRAELPLEDRWCPVCAKPAPRELMAGLGVVYGRHLRPLRVGSRDCEATELSMVQALRVELYGGVGNGADGPEAETRLLLQRPLATLRWVLDHGTGWGVPWNQVQEVSLALAAWDATEADRVLVGEADLPARGRLLAARDRLARAPKLVELIDQVLARCPEDLTAVGERLGQSLALTSAGPEVRDALRAAATGPKERTIATVDEITAVGVSLGLTDAQARPIAELLHGRIWHVVERVHAWRRTPAADALTVGWLRLVEERGPNRAAVLRELHPVAPLDTADRAIPEPPVAPAKAGTAIRAEALRKVRMPDGSWEVWRLDLPVPVRLELTPAIGVLDVVRELIPALERDPIACMLQLQEHLELQGWSADFRVRRRPGRRKNEK